MKLSHDQVRSIARLARLSLSEEELEKFSHQLSSILENFEILKQVDTAGVPPRTHAIGQRTVLRKDDVADSCSRDEILSNAPDQEEGCFRVQSILD